MTTGQAVKTYTLKSSPNSTPTFKIQYQSELNPQQYSAVVNTEGPVLCIAGAGSGKTRTLIYRVSRLIEMGTPPERILLLTFTRKAAQEMMKRASLLLDDRCKRVKGGTFHGFANYILRRYAEEAGLEKNFTIIDRGDAEDLLNLVRSDMGLAKTDSRFPKKNTIIDIFSKSVNTGRSFNEIIGNDYPQFIEHINTLEKLYEEYHKTKRQRNVLDYDDLLVELKMLLKCNENIRNKLSQEYQYIMIDEYQDTNLIQSEIGFLLASTHHNILAVGDDAQSIYSFRGAHFKNIMDFPKVYPDCKILPLEQNYRSTSHILNFANAILDSAKEKYPKKLFTDVEADQKPVFIKPESLSEQAEFIAQRVLELREEGVSLNEIAILFRAAWHSNELEVELNARNIPFVKYGGLKFTEAAHVKDILALAKIIANYRDPVSWHRILLLVEGLGPKSAQEIVKIICDGRPDLSSLDTYGKKKFGKYLSQLKTDILKVKESTDSPKIKLENLLQIYFPLLKTKYDDYIRRIDDLNSLTAMADRYASLEEFLDDLTLEIPEFTQDGAEASTKEDEFLTLSTIHSSKGLEWHTVFILSMIDGFIPSSRSLDDEANIEEERRLFYVACTRAKHNLYMLCPEHNRVRPYSMGNYSGISFSEPSRFLSEIPTFPELVEIWQLNPENIDH